MESIRVLIVEDDPFIALDIDLALTDAGCEVCGVASSEPEALSLGEATRPEFAVVDVRLAPGDGRVVAAELSRRYGTLVLFATAHCHDIPDLARTGAIGCLPKPYLARDVPLALRAVRELQAGRQPERLPDSMLSLVD